MLSYNPFRLHSGNLRLGHGILVEIMTSTQRVWQAYAHLLSLNGKRSSDIKDLRILMKKMKLKPKRSPSAKRHSKRIMKKRIKIMKQVMDDFSQALKDLENMIKNLKKIILSDETFQFRLIKEIRHLYKIVEKNFPENSHISDRMTESTLHALYHLMVHMEHTQHHAWVVSKRHSRDFTNIQDLSLAGNNLERNRIRRQTIELDHIRNRIGPLKKKIIHLSRVKSDEATHELHIDIHELITLYKEELHDLVHILHQADVLIRRTEMLLKGIEREAEALENHKLVHMIHKYHTLFNKLMKKVEVQARREYLDVKKIVKSVKKPKASHYHPERKHYPNPFIAVIKILFGIKQKHAANTDDYDKHHKRAA